MIRPRSMGAAATAAAQGLVALAVVSLGCGGRVVLHDLTKLERGEWPDRAISWCSHRNQDLKVGPDDWVELRYAPNGVAERFRLVSGSQWDILTRDVERARLPVSLLRAVRTLEVRPATAAPFIIDPCAGGACVDSCASDLVETIEQANSDLEVMVHRRPSTPLGPGDQVRVVRSFDLSALADPAATPRWISEQFTATVDDDGFLSIPPLDPDRALAEPQFLPDLYGGAVRSQASVRVYDRHTRVSLALLERCLDIHANPDAAIPSDCSPLQLDPGLRGNSDHRVSNLVHQIELIAPTWWLSVSGSGRHPVEYREGESVAMGVHRAYRRGTGTAIAWLAERPYITVIPRDPRAGELRPLPFFARHHTTRWSPFHDIRILPGDTILVTRGAPAYLHR
ncbi:MAG TPA: hypothetical protein RMI62_25395 [Polyangiaceae bacterium LLY-WYZ-15_(1-7)]|nr:hypothetical protein [Polyangiaceae bacterium LLY-WYZ-15_(1-7)]